MLDRQGPSSSGQVKVRVLVIDDDDIAREVMADTLRDAGFDVHTLASPIGASKAIGDRNIDAVVLDVMMPTISGDKLAKLLRQASKGKHLAIVLVSSRSLEELHELAVDARADAVVSKSDLDQLPRILKKAHLQRSLRKPVAS